MAVATFASPASAAKADAKDACKGNGWKSLQSGTGKTFKNQGDCVSYAAKGGSVFSPSLTIRTSCVDNFVRLEAVPSGFHANSTGEGHLRVVGFVIGVAVFNH